MLYNPEEKTKDEKKIKKLWDFSKQSKLYERWLQFKQHVLMKTKKKTNNKQTINILQNEKQ